MPIEVIILAAGKGTRMQSRQPKVLHCIGGRPMLLHGLKAVAALHPARVHVVVGDGAEQVMGIDLAALPPELPLNWVRQDAQLGTAHAALQALPMIDPTATVLVINGDTPLLTPTTLRQVCHVHTDADVHVNTPALTLATARLDEPHGLGRVVRDGDGAVGAIVEEADATSAQRAIREVNTNCLSARAEDLAQWLAGLATDNAPGEYYLTDVIRAAVADGRCVHTIAVDATEALGVNTKRELAVVERAYQRRATEQLLEQGVTLLDPTRVEVRGDCRFGRDCVVDINVILSGQVRVGDNVFIGAHTMLRDSVIADNCQIEAYSVIEQATIGARCRIGPFARIRPQCELHADARIGNFVELKQSTVGAGSKVNHLSYVGDSRLGARVNVGAGVITCNYDGAHKHPTTIGDDVFIGSNSALVAPLTVAAGATIGAGSTISKSVAPNALAVARTRQQTIPHWRRPKK